LTKTTKNDRIALNLKTTVMTHSEYLELRGRINNEFSPKIISAEIEASLGLICALICFSSSSKHEILFPVLGTIILILTICFGITKWMKLDFKKDGYIALLDEAFRKEKSKEETLHMESFSKLFPQVPMDPVAFATKD
jgi:hypothetical protein